MTIFPCEQLSGLRTPFYYYDTQLLSDTLQVCLKAATSCMNSHVHYAVKANANPRLLRQIAEAGLGADCVSGGEIEAALRAGFPPKHIVFAGVGKTDDEITLALKAQIGCFNVESLDEIAVIAQLAEKLDCIAPVALRINPDVDAHTHEKITTGRSENKFGISSHDMLKAVQYAEKFVHIKWLGLHFHIGSQITDMQPFQALSERINELVAKLASAGRFPQWINVGGGLGVDYEQPDDHPIACFERYFNTFHQHLRLAGQQQVHFELGRSLVAQCGSLVSRVVFVKQGEQKKFLILDAGFTDLIRPAMYGAHHATQNLTVLSANSSRGSRRAELYDVVGPICESSDVFATQEPLPASQRGDLITLRSAGAYGEVMASEYNCRPLPKAYFSEDFR